MIDENTYVLQELIRQQELSRKDDDVPRLNIELPSLKPRTAIGVRINERFERYRAKLNVPSTRTAIIWKVARAVEEGRVDEDRIESIFPRLEVAQNRGAYFVACCKGAFLACGLSWIEEDWSNV